MEKTTKHEYDSEDDYYNENSDTRGRGTIFDVYHIDENEKRNSLPSKKVNLSKLVERGHLHVLEYLHEELNYFLGLQRYCFPAIQHGQIEILEWLDRINVMKTSALHFGYIDNGVLSKKGYCEYAIESGNVEVLDRLQEMGYEITSSDAFADAIRSKSTDMIQYCFDVGHVDFYGIDFAIKEANSVDVFRLMFELGYEFEGIKEWCDEFDMVKSFEIIKFLRSISVPWDDDIMINIVAYGTLEMIQNAHEDGCPWTICGAEYISLLKSDRCSLDKLNYLSRNGCIFDYYEFSTDLVNILRQKKELALLHYFVGKNSRFDNRLFREILKDWRSKVWTEGISYLLETGKDVEKSKSIEEAFCESTDMDSIKYFHSLGLPWCLDSSRNTKLLSKIACYNEFDDVKWAYELVQYIKEEWGKDRIRQKDQWKVNLAFFEENKMLDKTFLENSKFGQINSKNVQEVGDAKLKSCVYCFAEPNLAWFNIDFSFLRMLAKHGYTFRSQSEKESVIKEAYIKCCHYHRYEDFRKRLTIFVGMGVWEL